MHIVVPICLRQPRHVVPAVPQYQFTHLLTVSGHYTGQPGARFTKSLTTNLGKT